MLYQIKGKFQKISLSLLGKNFSANQATFWGWFFSFAYAFSVYYGFLAETSFLLLLTPVWALLRMMMNAMDGWLARKQGTASAAGEIWNEASDVLGDMICYGVYLFVFPGSFLSLSVFLLSIWMAEFFGVMGKSLPGGERRQESLGGAKPERMILLTGMAVALYFRPEFVLVLNSVFWVLSGLTLATAFRRIYESVQAARGKAYVSFTKYGE